MEYNPFSYELHEDPYPTYHQLREEAPCFHNAELDFWALSRFQDVWDATLNWKTFSSSPGPLLELEDRDGELFSILSMDPPRHTRVRNIVSRGFTPRRIAALEPAVRATTERLLDALGGSGPRDLLGEFATRLPMEVMSTLLGVPDKDREGVRAWLEAFIARDPDRVEVPVEAAEAGKASRQYLHELLARRRAEPEDDLMSVIAHAEVDGEEGPERLSDDEVVAFCTLLWNAGNETATTLIASAVVLLDAHSDQREVLTREPERIPGAIEEVLRFDAPIQYQGRAITHELVLHGETIPRGARIVLITAAAERDEREFPEPDRFDISRRFERSLHFGYGHHVCLGRSLARLQGRVALEGLLKRYPNHSVQRDGVERSHSSNLRGYAAVPILTGTSAT
ncbi:MAG: cytochrome P450 [bacterium]|nr:cytochrome P450 [bacterium]